MENYNNILCITHRELTSNIISDANYYALKQRDKLNVVRRGCYGTPALIEFKSLPPKIKEAVVVKYGNPEERAKDNSIEKHWKKNYKAVEFFSQYKLADGRYLHAEKQKEYVANASMLDAIIITVNECTAARHSRNNTTHGMWKTITETTRSLKSTYGHTLPDNLRRLQDKVNNYKRNGFDSLTSGKFLNDNSRKVTAMIERLLLSIYTMPNKPFGTDIRGVYASFLSGKIDIYDTVTGEIFDRDMFVRNNKPVQISDGTIWNYINNPMNRAIVDKVRNGQKYYNDLHRPHHNRRSPEFSFSKISLDDRDLFKEKTSKKRVKAYYAYDVASGCVIGTAYSMSKDEELFLDCLRSVLKTCDKGDFGMPMEVEVEHHLVSKFFDDLAIMFPFLRICAAGNSQEKRAEHMNKAKKYSTEKQMMKGVGRWWAKSEAYLVTQDKINDEFVEQTFDYEKIIALDIESIKIYNNTLHPKQKKYPNMTRWDVLIHHMNPELPKINKAVLYRYIGFKTDTSIRRSQYLHVKGEKYALPSSNIIEKLKPNNYEVNAYYIPEESGEIKEVYVYQNGEYLCKCEKLTSYNEAQAEQTSIDKAAQLNQMKYIAEFDKTIKENKPDRIGIIENKMLEIVLQEPLKIVSTEPIINDFEYACMDYNREYMESRAITEV